MQEQLISFETAKLAKEKGFNIKTSQAYCDFDEHILYDYHHGDEEIIPPIYNKLVSSDYEEYKTIKYYVPTQSLLQKWLREKHNIHIEINEIPIKNNENIIHKFYIVLRGLKHELNLDDDDQGNWYPILSKTHTGYEVFKTYEKALEIGLQEALKLI